ncbi:MAG: bifunctional lysylphosphatidylglycerol flippase/synthetase MprF [Solirubrobacteraceae bacterium]
MPIIGARIRFLTVRQSAALAVAVLAVDTVLSGVASDDPRQALLGGLIPPDLPSELQVLSVMVGLALLAVAPRLWRGTRTAVPLAAGGLLMLAVTSLAKGRWEAAGLEICLATLITLGRRSFPIGCRNRPQLAVVCSAVGAWGLTYLALRLAPLVPSHGGHALAGALHHSVVAHSVRGSLAGGHLSGAWLSVIEGLIAAAAVTSAVALRSLLSPAPSANQHVEHEYRLARALLDCHGTDSLSPFILRPDKALHLGAGGVLSYRVIRGTAIVSSDPVAPEGAAGDVLASFLTTARARGWGVAVWAASGRHLDEYRRLGLRAICVGEEAFVDPRGFTLEGRPVRKLRQSVHRVQRRGWELSVREGRAIDAALEAEIGALELAWRGRQRHLHGFAMGMGRFDAVLRADDLYVLARSPEGRLGAVMRFIGHRGKLSLDTMRRVGETPNGLNEALVCRALEAARERGVPEVSLNYAGLAQLVHGEPISNPMARALTKLVMAPLGRRFQMERLVRFNEKFSPEWRPRFLVYESRGALPKAVLRVLQAEGYLPEPRRRRRRRARLPAAPAVTGSPHAGRVG